MTHDDEPTGEDSRSQDATSGDDRPVTDSPESSMSQPDWETLVDAVRTRLQAQIGVWPEKVTATVDLVDNATSSDVPETGDIVIYVHGYLGEGRLDGMNLSGANQAAAFQQALAEEFDTRPTSAPTVVAATWNSSTLWPRATRRAVSAGETLAEWLTANAGDYNRVTVVGHSLGGQVTLHALNRLTEATVDSVALLGAAVLPEHVYTEFRDGIESAVTSGVFNYYSRNDFVVCRLYGFRAGDAGIGCTGAVLEGGRELGSLPANYIDVDVSPDVTRHMDYYKPLQESKTGNCVHELAERQLRGDSAD